MNNFIAIAVVILTWLFFFYLGHVLGKASELTQEKQYLDEIDDLSAEVKRLKTNADGLSMDIVYLQNRCLVLTQGTMCKYCNIDTCIYKEQEDET